VHLATFTGWSARKATVRTASASRHLALAWRNTWAAPAPLFFVPSYVLLRVPIFQQTSPSRPVGASGYIIIIISFACALPQNQILPFSQAQPYDDDGSLWPQPAATAAGDKDGKGKSLVPEHGSLSRANLCHFWTMRVRSLRKNSRIIVSYVHLPCRYYWLGPTCVLNSEWECGIITLLPRKFDTSCNRAFSLQISYLDIFVLPRTECLVWSCRLGPISSPYIYAWCTTKAKDLHVSWRSRWP
jgi:hypothetical protein